MTTSPKCTVSYPRYRGEIESIPTAFAGSSSHASTIVSAKRAGGSILKLFFTISKSYFKFCPTTYPRNSEPIAAFAASEEI